VAPVVGRLRARKAHRPTGAAAGTSVVIYAGTGGDTFNVGSAANTFDSIQGPITIDGEANGALMVNDAGTTTIQQWVVANSFIDRYPFGGSPPAVPQINYHNLGAVRLTTGAARAFIGIYSTAAGMTTTVNGNNSGDQFIVGNFDRLDDIQGPLALHGSGLDYFSAVDGLNTIGHTYTLTTGKLQRDGGIADITYDGMGSFVLSTANNSLGHTSSIVNVQSLSVELADLAVAKGDTVTVGQNGSLANLTGDLLIQGLIGQAPKQITLDDHADPSARTVTLGSDAFFGYLVSGLASSSQGLGRIGVHVDPATPVAINTGPAGNVFVVHNFAGAPALTLNALAGSGFANTLDYSAYNGTVLVSLPRGYATGFSGIKNICNVNGSNGNNLIVGDANPNVIKGGTGRNVLVGGTGSDTLDARTSAGNDILIGGYTDWDRSLDALQKIMDEWDRTDLGFNDRRGDLLGNGNSLGLKPLNVLPNGQAVLLTPATNPTSTNGTVHGDATPDTLLGSLNVANWFFVDSNGDDPDNFSSKRGDKKTSVR
jgi:hypothetical protein